MAKGEVKYFTVQNALRFQYAQAAGWLLQLAFMPAMFCETLGIDTKTFDDTSMACLLACMASICAGCMLSLMAAAQMGEKGQKLMLLVYTITCVGFSAVIITHRAVATPFGFQFNLGVQLSNILFNSYVMHINRRKGGVKPEPKDCRLQNCLRFSYVQIVLWCLAFNFDGEGTWKTMGGSISGSAGPYILGLMGMLIALMASNTIVAAEFLGASDAKKFAQYAIAGQMVWQFVFVYCAADQFMLASLQQAQFQMFVWLLNILVLVYGLYPASNLTWFSRWLYINMYMFVVMATVNPALMWTLGGAAPMSAEATYFMGAMMCFLFCVNVVVAQLDEASQMKMCKYTFYGYCYMITMASLGKIDMGMWFGQACVEMCICYYLGNPACFEYFTMPSMKASMKASSPNSRKRSSTPKMKKA